MEKTKKSIVRYLYEDVEKAQKSFVSGMRKIIGDDECEMFDEYGPVGDKVCADIVNKHGFVVSVLLDKVKCDNGVFYFHAAEIDNEECDEWLSEYYFLDNLCALLSCVVPNF